MLLVDTAKNQTQEMTLVTLAEAIDKTKTDSKMKAPPLMEMPVTKAGSNQSPNPSVNLQR